jgi:dTDP-4-dehydrorhamnose 3,5-epimerase/CDP-3, 6-dideoxy-D-glycero-D-glycero-4-hexulose-5-epimerase
MIEATKTKFNGLYILSNKIHYDNRGSFKKLLSKDDFESMSLESNFSELYYSISKKDVIRGMHFQLVPKDHTKMVYVIDGSILDVCLDIRKKSKTYGQYFSIKLTGNDNTYLYIPKGFAHGFASLENNSIVHYAQTSCYSKEHDTGIRYDSFGFNWNIMNPIVSDRDKSFLNLCDLKTDF